MKSLIKKILNSSFFQAILAFLGACYIRFVHKTTKWQFIGIEHVEQCLADKTPLIVCFWHGRMMMLPCEWRWKQSFSMLLSAHRDGKLIGQVLSHFNIDIIYGSSTRGGSEAMIHMVKKLQNGTVIGITPDGPRGPARTVAPGIVALAELAKAKIIAVSYSSSKMKKLKTWDQFCLPKPFGRGVFVVSEPIQLDGKDRTEISHAIKESLDKVSLMADEIATSQF